MLVDSFQLLDDLSVDPFAKSAPKPLRNSPAKSKRDPLKSPTKSKRDLLKSPAESARALLKMGACGSSRSITACTAARFRAYPKSSSGAEISKPQHTPHPTPHTLANLSAAEISKTEALNPKSETRNPNPEVVARTRQVPRSRAAPLLLVVGYDRRSLLIVT